MKTPYYKGIGLLLIFFILFFVVSFTNNSHFPQLVIVGEASVGTWMSGVLLVISATVCLLTGMRRDGYFWFLMTIFFLLLALDERFMFHEQLKERLIFTYHLSQKARFIYELPAIAGACAGAFMAYLLWKQLKGGSRILLLCAVALGTISVVMDIFTMGVLPEDSCKIIAELLLACALLKTAGE